MTYNPSIPQAEDDMSVSQGDLLTNFGELNTVYSEDHVALDASANKGKHKKASFVSQGSDPDVDSPSTLENEVALFALEDGTDTEIYARRESNGDVNQVTKDGSLFMGIHPLFSINISDLTPNSNTGAGTYNFTVNSSYNFDSASSLRVTASKCRYRFYFTNQALDDTGTPTNKYMFDISGFRNSSKITLGKIPNTAVYDTYIQPNFIEITFVDDSNTLVGALTGASIVCWRVQ